MDKEPKPEVCSNPDCRDGKEHVPYGHKFGEWCWVDCKTCHGTGLKPDEGRLLTPDEAHAFELAFMKRKFENRGNNRWKFVIKPMLKAQRDLTASSKDAGILLKCFLARHEAFYHGVETIKAECQARVEEVFGEIDECRARTDCFQEDNSVAYRAGDVIIPQVYWQALKEKEGVK